MAIIDIRQPRLSSLDPFGKLRVDGEPRRTVDVAQDDPEAFEGSKEPAVNFVGGWLSIGIAVCVVVLIAIWLAAGSANSHPD